MKILILGLILIAACNAGLGLLTAASTAALLLVHLGRQEIIGGNIRGREKIVLGVGLGGATLVVVLLKCAFIFFAWVSLSTVFPALPAAMKAALAWFGTL